MERERGEQLAQETWDRMAKFVQTGMKRGLVQGYILEGPIDVPTQFTVFAGVFPEIGATVENGRYAIASQSQIDDDATTINRKILSLQVPERLITRPPTREEEEDARNFDIGLAVAGLPAIVLGLGRAQETGEEVITLFTTFNRSAQRALELIQTRVRFRMHNLN